MQIITHVKTSTDLFFIHHTPPRRKNPSSYGGVVGGIAAVEPTQTPERIRTEHAREHEQMRSSRHTLTLGTEFIRQYQKMYLESRCDGYTSRQFNFCFFSLAANERGHSLSRVAAP